MNWASFLPFSQALADPVTRGGVVGVGAMLILAPLLLRGLLCLGRIGRGQYEEMFLRWKSWLWLVALISIPILLGPGWVVLAVAGLSLVCYREFARATGLFREKWVGAAVLLGIGGLAVACLRHDHRLLQAFAVGTVGLVIIVTIPTDHPQGYLQRAALGIMGFLLCGYSFSHLGLMAGDARARPLLVLLLLGVEMNDIFAYCVGRACGVRKLLPRTSPGKTVAGALGALVLTMVLVAVIAHSVFRGTPVDRCDRLLLLGLIVGGLGQLGDLLFSAIKRDLGLKDFGVAIPGHGGWLDRFDSLVLVPPAVYYLLTFGLTSPGVPPLVGSMIGVGP